MKEVIGIAKVFTEPLERRLRREFNTMNESSVVWRKEGEREGEGGERGEGRRGKGGTEGGGQRFSTKFVQQQNVQ